MLNPHHFYAQGWTCSSEQVCQSTRPALSMHRHSTPSRLVFLCLLLSSFISSGCNILNGNIFLGVDKEANTTDMSPDASIPWCLNNEHVLNNECIPCKPGSTNKSGDDPTGRDTTCHITPCAQNEHVQNHMCVSCAPGMTHKAGNDPTGKDTSCLAVLCKAQERVQNNKCVACPQGSYNDMGGDDASGPNTSCASILCAQNEHVQNHVCTPCPKDTSKVAGDDALGPDTFCKDRCGLIFDVSCAEFEEAYIKASNAEEYNNFGSSVAFSQDTLVVGAPGEEKGGAAHVFIRTDSDSTWKQQAYLTASNSEFSDNFGSRVAIDGDTIVLGTHRKDNNSGAVYVFTRTGDSWEEQAYIKAINSEEDDYFGSSVAIDGDTIVVGAYGEDSDATGVNKDDTNNTAPESGAAYVFTRSGSTWEQQAYIKASNTGAQDRFGRNVAIDGDTIVIGADGEGSSSTGVDGDENDTAFFEESGAAYVFIRIGAMWVQQAYIKASNSDRTDRFGSSLAIDGDTIIVGAVEEQSNATGVNGDETLNVFHSGSGAVYVFTRTDFTWEQQAYIKASNPGPGNKFGTSVALHEHTLLVSAPYEDSNATGLNGDQDNYNSDSSGAVYMFTRTDNEWTQQAYVKASNTDSYDYFGGDIALDEGILAIGSPGESSRSRVIDGNQSSNDVRRSGAVYIRKVAP